MRSLYISFVSEFYKSRKTLAFWAAIILPVLICALIAFGYYTNSEKVLKYNYPGLALWGQFSSASLGVMGMLILPFYVMFMAFSVNNIEHKNDTWKTLFAQPLNKFSIYAAKYLYAVFLLLICLVLFGTLTVLSGHILQALVPKYTFSDYNPVLLLSKFYLKLFLASLGILSLQFVLSLLWSDFLKPMGIGFIGTISGIITANVGWKYAYLIPYSDPTIALKVTKTKNANFEEFPIFTAEIWASLICAVIFFILGYFILAKKNIK